MPQKPLNKPGRKIDKKQAANKHGKAQRVTKKGRFDVAPKKAKLVALHNENKELSKAINASNEATAAGMAAQNGGRLNVVKAPPPVLAPADQKKKMKAQKEQES